MHLRLKRSAVMALALITCPAVCGAQPTDPTRPAATADKPAAAKALPPRVEGGLVPFHTVELIEPGSAPLTPLRMAPTVGEQTAFVMIQKSKISIAPTGSKLSDEINAPDVRTIYLFTVKSADSREYVSEIEVIGVTLTADPKDEMAQQIAMSMGAGLSATTGIKGTVVSDARGMIRSVEFAAPAGAPKTTVDAVNSARQIISTFGLPLPEQPIGVGGKWRVLSRIGSGGGVIEQTSTYTLTSLSNGVAKIGMDFTQSAARQSIDMVGAPAGADVVLDSHSGGGTTTIEVNVAKPITTKLEATSEVTTQIVAIMPEQGESGIQQRVRSTLTIESMSKDKAMALIAQANQPPATAPGSTSEKPAEPPAKAP